MSVVYTGSRQGLRTSYSLPQRYRYCVVRKDLREQKVHDMEKFPSPELARPRHGRALFRLARKRQNQPAEIKTAGPRSSVKPIEELVRGKMRQREYGAAQVYGSELLCHTR